ncbi:DUF475 domain-containing protein [Candidatus Pacearchaeota archaeon]|nr:DUF475 domain-containing protein [Candidatus Pacearchaeota archaeon]
MDFLTIIVIVLGLCLFETISSIDNAIINAEVLSTMSEKAKRWFLLWGLLFAVFLIRGLLPWAIVWGFNPSLGPVGALTSTFSNDPAIEAIIEQSASVLLIAGGTFLVFLFFSWLFLEDKNFGLPKTEKFFLKNGIWFYSVISVMLIILVWFSIKINNLMALGAVIGSTAFFITHDFKKSAEENEKKLMRKDMSDMSKLLYLQVIDATFSIDGVLGAFAFTLSVPLILIGNGIGALVVRQVTVGNIKRIKKYIYLKNGAMYSIFVLGLIMILDSFGVNIPSYLSPIATFLIVGIFFYKSHLAVKDINDEEDEE